MLELLYMTALAGLAGAGVAVLNQALPSGELPYKPFSCRTCMSGWGAFIAALLLLRIAGIAPRFGDLAWWVFDVYSAVFAHWFVVAVAGTGLAHLVLGLADGNGTLEVPDFAGLDAEDGD